VAAVDPAYGDSGAWQKVSFLRLDRLPASEALASVADMLEGMDGAALRSELGQEVMQLTRELTERREREASAPPAAAEFLTGEDGPEEPRLVEAIGGSQNPSSESVAPEPQIPDDAANDSDIEGAQPIRQGEIVALEEVTRAPKVLRMTRPQNPPLARQRRVRGEYLAQMLIGPDGKVEQIRVVTVPGEKLGFEEAVAEASKGWLFGPAVVDGVPVRTWIPIRILFGD
jgi:TonB family protein